jgi:hypothetical protein
MSKHQIPSPVAIDHSTQPPSQSHSESSSASASSPSSPLAVSLKEGSGRFVYPDGAIYEGSYVTNSNGVKVKNGQGNYSDGHSSYQGRWENDRMHGRGFYIGASGATYDGDFLDSKFHGQGIYKWPDGAEYRGLWSYNKMHGTGSYTAADGLQFVGEYYNGLFVEGSTHVAVR